MGLDNYYLLSTYIGKQVATCLYLYYRGNMTP